MISEFIKQGIVLRLTYSLKTTFIALTLVGFSSVGLAQSSERYEFSDRHMGTLFRIVLYAPSDSIAQTAAQVAFNRVEELNKALSDYIPEKDPLRRGDCQAATATNKSLLGGADAS